ncbi:MAG TPA: hypothetical protein VIU40_05395 [Geobacteraceae bacterium]
MSARKLAALVIKLISFYLLATNFFSALALFLFLPFKVYQTEQFPVQFGYAEAAIQFVSTFIYFGGLLYGDRLARWIVREDWTISSEAGDGSAFWSRTVPVLMVMGTGILIIGTSASMLMSKIVLWLVVTETETFFYPMPSQILGPLLSLAFGAYLFLRPGSLLKLFQRYGKAD